MSNITAGYGRFSDLITGKFSRYLEYYKVMTKMSILHV